MAATIGGGSERGRQGHSEAGLGYGGGGDKKWLKLKYLGGGYLASRWNKLQSFVSQV